MTLSEKSAYLKGLMEGMELDTETKEGKMLSAIVDLLGDISRTVGELAENALNVSDELDDIEEDLDEIYEYLSDDDYDEDDEEEDEDEDEDLEYDFDDTTVYEVECKCGEVIDFDEETLEQGSIVCPNCGELLEFSVDDEDEEAPEA